MNNNEKLNPMKEIEKNVEQQNSVNQVEKGVEQISKSGSASTKKDEGPDHAKEVLKSPQQSPKGKVDDKNHQGKKS